MRSEAHVYKTTPQGELSLYFFYPDEAEGPQAAIVFFFGGGWVSGEPDRFFPNCEKLAAQGIIAISADYRTEERHGTSPDACVADGKSAVRWIRANAATYGIDPNRIVAAGSSAGGHVAASTVLLPDASEDKPAYPDVSCVPDALVLLNPVVDTTETGYGAEKISGDPRRLSPLHHMREGIPPTLVIHGDVDMVVPFANAEAFTSAMIAAGNRCTLVPFEGMEHGFHYYDPQNPAIFHKVMDVVQQFLSDEGFLA